MERPACNFCPFDPDHGSTRICEVVQQDLDSHLRKSSSKQPHDVAVVFDIFVRVVHYLGATVSGKLLLEAMLVLIIE
jgi:hypothetical protein